MDEHYELGVAFKDSLVPRAVEWYTGEAAQPLFEDEGEYGDEGDFEEYEDTEPEPVPRRR
jgi:hypothetical protein